MINNDTNLKKQSGFKVREEYIFAFITILFGVLFVLITPPFSGKGEVHHFVLAFAKSEGQNMLKSDDGQAGFMIPKSIIMTTQDFENAKMKNDGKLSGELIDKYSKLKLHINDRIFYELTEKNINKLSYLPGIIGIWIGKQINSNTIYLLWFTRIAGLLFFVIITFFAIRTVPFFKGVFLLLALLPTSIYQAATVNNEFLAYSFSLLLIAFIFRISQSNDKISVIQLVVIILSASILRFVSGFYLLLPFLALLIPSQKFGNAAYKYSVIGFFLILVFLPSLFGMGFYNTGSMAFIDSSSGFVADSSMSLSYYLSAPFLFITTILNNIIFQGGYWLQTAFAGFGNAGLSPNVVFSIIGLLAILAVALFDGNEADETISKYTSLSLAIVSSLILIGSFLIIASPVGSAKIEYLTGSYFLPIAPLFLIMLFNNTYKNELFNKFGSIILGIWSIILLIIAALFIGNNF